MGGIPCQSKGQPVCDPPGHLEGAPVQPDAAGGDVIDHGAGGQVDGHQEDHVCGKPYRKEDGDQEVGRGRAQRQIVAEDEEDDDGDGDEGDEGKDLGAQGRGRRGFNHGGGGHAPGIFYRSAGRRVCESRCRDATMSGRLVLSMKALVVDTLGEGRTLASLCHTAGT